MDDERYEDDAWFDDIAYRIKSGYYGNAQSKPRNLYAERRRLGTIPKTLPGNQQRSK